jgi:integrase
MSIRKRKWQNNSGEQTAWVVDYFDQNDTRHIKTFATKREATDWLAETQVEVKKGTHTPASKSITVAEAGELWIAQAEADGLEYATVRGYRQHLELHIKPFLGSQKLSGLTVADVQGYRNRLLREGRSRVMVKKVVSSLGSILAGAIAIGNVNRNVVHEQSKQQRTRHRRVEARGKRKLEAGVDYPTIAELRALLTCQGRLRPVLMTAIFTGLRASELRGLTWADVELDRKVLHVRQRADRRNVIGSPKSEAGKRAVPLVPMVVNTLKEWRLACPKGEANLVFPNLNGDVWALRNLCRSIYPVQRELIGKHYGLHALRHAAASLFIEEGFSPKRVQALMGHSSIQVTFDVYGHLWATPDEEDELQRLQARLLG